MLWVCWFFLFSSYSKIYCFQQGSVQTKCNHPLNTWLFVHVCLGSRKSGDLRKHPIGRQVYIIPDCIVAIFPVIDCSDIYTCIYIYEENGFLLVCTWSARVTCMNDRTDVTVRWYIYDLHVKITFNDIYVPRNASASVIRDELVACDVNCLLT